MLQLQASYEALSVRDIISGKASR
jgi:hypothetical protein